MLVPTLHAVHLPRRLAVLLSALGLLACGDSGSAGGDGGAGGAVPDDGRFRPDPSGVAIDEADACGRLLDAAENVRGELQCVLTLRTCPDLVRLPAGDSCLNYDEGTIDGCVDYLEASADCDELKARLESCVFLPIEGSAPAGCPG
jgi:hypothetical protein